MLGIRVCFCVITSVTIAVILFKSFLPTVPLQITRTIQLHTPQRLRVATFIQGESSNFSVHAAEACTTEQRQSHLEAMCLAQPGINTAFSPNDVKSYNRFVVDDEHNVLYCVVPKVGCTSWKSLLVQQSSKYKSEAAHPMNNPNKFHSRKWLAKYGIRWMHKFPMHDIKWRLEKYFKFVIVRHPFARLYSAYKDKIQSTKNITFQSFLESMSRDINSRLSGVKDDSVLSDHHFKQQYRLCHPCSIKYDYIAKLETIQADSTVLLPKFNATQLPTLNVKADTNDVHGNAMALRLENKAHWIDVINGVPENQLEILRRFYALDFQAFGYEWDTPSGPLCNSQRDKGSSCC